MIKMIYRTAIIAMIAMTMLTGSALANLVYSDAWFWGESSAVLFDKDGDRITDLGNAKNAYSIQIFSSSVEFEDGEEFFDFGGGATLPTGDVRFQFRDNDNIYDLYDDFWYRADFDPFDLIGEINFGTINEFTFTVDAIDAVRFSDDFDRGSPSIDIDLFGFLNENRNMRVFLDISLDPYFNDDELWAGFWDVGVYIWADIDPDMFYDDVPVPEPGTLVLLGTGLLGAAAIVRRKMKK